MPAVSRARQSVLDNFENGALHRKAVDNLWRIAKTAPMFSKVSKRKDGSLVRRSARLINSNAYKVAVSGACAALVGETGIDMKHLGMDVKADSKTRPFSMSLAPGAAFMLEQFLSSIVLEIAHHSRTIRTGLGKHARNNKEIIKIAIAQVKESIFDAAAGVPVETVVLPFVLARRKRAGEEVAPGEVDADEMAAEEDDEEDEGGEDDKAEEEEGADDE